MSPKCPKCDTDNTPDSQFCKKCATPLPEQVFPTKTIETPIDVLKSGSTFADRYQIIEELGEGGMGQVYKVLDQETDEKIAIKLINPDISTDKKIIERFRNELTTARKIAHRNVCRMYDLNKEGDDYYITMELVSGGDLKKFIRRARRLDTETAISIAKQICEGLEEAHGLGIVHRDLKSNNIMIDDDGNVKIMDFGIARSKKSKGITGSGVIIGTPEYMSPEQVEAKEVDSRSDIYSLGIILYEMLTGRLPFEADTPIALGIKHKSEIPMNPEEYNPQIPDDLSGVILKCLEKDKELRYQSAAEIRTDLERIEQGLPTTEKIAAKTKHKTVKIGEIKLTNLILYGGASILVIAIVLTGIFLLTGRQKVIDSIAILPFSNVSGDPNLDYLSDGITENIINKLTQLPSLKKVIARNSVFHYKGREIIPQEVGQELGVRALLISQMDKRDDVLSISTELINSVDNSRLWGNVYKQKSTEIFLVQEDITQSIIESLKLKLTGIEVERLTKNYTENSEAYDFYLMGRFAMQKRKQKEFWKAIDYFEQAIDLDPDYALAYSGIADAYSLLGDFGILPFGDAYSKARENALKALSIDDSIAEAYTSLARIKVNYDYDWPGAEQDFLKAIELNEGYDTAHKWYAVLFLSSIGRHEEAIKEVKRAFELDPLNLGLKRSIGRTYLRARQYNKAIDELLKAIEIDPENRIAHSDLGETYFRQGRYDEALDIFQELDMEFWIAFTLTKMGNDKKARDLFNKWTKDPPYNLPRIAELCFALGEDDRGFELLQKAYDGRFLRLAILIDPDFDRVRSDPRFKEILKKMNLN